MTETDSGSLSAQVYVQPEKKNFFILHAHGFLVGFLMEQRGIHFGLCHQQIPYQTMSDIFLSMKRQVEARNHTQNTELSQILILLGKYHSDRLMYSGTRNRM